ncbi:MAG: 4-demethylwyosine synthase TYW1 [Candidatus Bilamarchaeaceae archaeon]
MESPHKNEGESPSGFCFSEEMRAGLLKKQYGLAGRHSAVQICGWTKKALRRKGYCYKSKFYGIETHACAQMSPSAAWCSQNCIFCWRPMEWMGLPSDGASEGQVDPPELIIEKVVEQRRRLFSGLGGAVDSNRRMFEDGFSRFPAHWAISLSGEPTLYPRLPELIRMLKENPAVKSVFLVTNGQEPEMLLRLKKENALPTQLYISVDAPDKEAFFRVNAPLHADGWERLGKSLELIADFPCRRVLRFTVIKEINEREGMLPLYGELFGKSRADFVEVKAYMHLGYSRKRLSASNMPSHEEIREISRALVDFLPGFRYEDEDPPSRVVLLKNKKSRYPNIISTVEG